MISLSERTLLVTGGDGFIGRRIVEQFLDEDLRIVLLSQPKFYQSTVRLVEHWESLPSSRASLNVVTGDITKPELGLSDSDRSFLQEATTDLIHLAAAYDLSIDRETGKRINVDGTNNVVEFARTLENLDRLGYMSTTAISGDYESTYGESDYDVGQSFNNFYEKTKFEAEGIVRGAAEELPVIIFRPTTVVGDSKTGEIDRIHGPYYLIRTIDRNLHLVIPDTGKSKFHIEPVDFVAEAIYEIFRDPGATGQCYQLADSAPPTYREFIEMVCDYWDKIPPLLEVPPRLMEPLFSVPGAEQLLGLPAEAFDYSHLNRQYSTTNTNEALEGTEVNCPPVQEYLETMLDYYQDHLGRGKTRDERW